MGHPFLELLRLPEFLEVSFDDGNIRSFWTQRRVQCEFLARLFDTFLCAVQQTAFRLWVCLRGLPPGICAVFRFVFCIFFLVLSFFSIALAQEVVRTRSLCWPSEVFFEGSLGRIEATNRKTTRLNSSHLG